MGKTDKPIGVFPISNTGGIANALGMPVGTVKSFCRRNGLLGEGGSGITISPETMNGAKDEMNSLARQKRPADMEFDGRCLSCGRPVAQVPGRRQKRFCSDKCRLGWWNGNRGLVQATKRQTVRCKCCGRRFDGMGSRDRKYCSHECYIRHRFGGGNGDGKG